MSDTTGRTGFRVTHTKAVGERRAIVHEMMRELDPKAVEYWARENTNIVVEDEVLDCGFVNDGTGRFVRATSMQEVIDYGQSRVDRLSSPLREDKPDKKGKMRGGTVTTSMFVAHLPKSLCKEVPDFYGKGRSRWIARDRDEAMKYFTDVLRFLGKNVIPGGFEAILGFDVQHSETTPHVQVLADTFADDPEHEGQLRPEWSRAYAAHRDVKREDGKMLTGREKLERYQDDLKAYMVARGWPVERDVDPLRHDKTATKAVYGAMKDKERALAEQEQKLVADRAAAHSEIASEIEATVDELAGRWEALNAERAAVESEREQLQKDKQKALEEARTQGYADGFKEAHTQGYAKGFEEGHSEVDALKEQVSEQLNHAKAIVAVIEKRNVSLPLTHARETFRIATQVFADRLKKKGVQPDIVDDAKRWADGFRNAPAFDEYVMKPAKEAYENSKKHTQQLRQMVNESTEQLGSSKPDLESRPQQTRDGMEF